MAIVYQDSEPGKVCTKCKEWRPVARYPSHPCCGALERQGTIYSLHALHPGEVYGT